MKKYYSSPEFEVIKVEITGDTLNSSPTESIPEVIETTENPDIGEIEF